jgi:hypothetical protein
MIDTDEREGPYWIKRWARLLLTSVVPFIRRKWTEIIDGLRASGTR